MALFPKSSNPKAADAGESERDYRAEADYRTLADADTIGRDRGRHSAALAHGKSQQDVFGRLSGHSKSKRGASKRGFTPAMRGLSSGGR